MLKAAAIDRHWSIGPPLTLFLSLTYTYDTTMTTREGNQCFAAAAAALSQLSTAQHSRECAVVVVVFVVHSKKNPNQTGNKIGTIGKKGGKSKEETRKEGNKEGRKKKKKKKTDDER